MLMGLLLYIYIYIKSTFSVGKHYRQKVNQSQNIFLKRRERGGGKKKKKKKKKKKRKSKTLTWPDNKIRNSFKFSFSQNKNFMKCMTCRTKNFEIVLLNFFY